MSEHCLTIIKFKTKQTKTLFFWKEKSVVLLAIIYIFGTKGVEFLCHTWQYSGAKPSLVLGCWFWRRSGNHAVVGLEPRPSVYKACFLFSLLSYYYSLHFFRINIFVLVIFIFPLTIWLIEFCYDLKRIYLMGLVQEKSIWLKNHTIFQNFS